MTNWETALTQAAAPVTIRRKKGRIPGFAKPPVPGGVIWCGTNRPRKKFGERKNGWSLAPAVNELVLQQCQGLTVLHLFGGRASFGVRMDLDPSTLPHVVADAYFPPFPRDSFDVVFLDPPFTQMHQQEKRALLFAAAWMARKWVYWHHTVWIDADRGLQLDEWWLIRQGTQCAIRVLERFAVREPKRRPYRPGEFERGYPLKYNRWAREQNQTTLPLDLTIGANLPKDREQTGHVFLGDWQ